MDNSNSNFVTYPALGINHLAFFFLPLSLGQEVGIFLHFVDYNSHECAVVTELLQSYIAQFQTTTAVVAAGSNRANWWGDKSTTICAKQAAVKQALQWKFRTNPGEACANSKLR